MKAKTLGMLALTGGLLVATQANAADPATLARDKGCLACHSVDKKIVGPAYKDVAAKYKGQDVVAKLVKKVKNGGKGVWGEIPMPPNAAVSEDDIKTIVEWVLKQ